MSELDHDQEDEDLPVRPRPAKKSGAKSKPKTDRVSTKQNPPKPRAQPEREKKRKTPPPEEWLDTIVTLPLLIEVSLLRDAGYPVPEHSATTVARVRRDFKLWLEDMDIDWDLSPGWVFAVSYGMALGSPLLPIALGAVHKVEKKSEPKPEDPPSSAPSTAQTPEDVEERVKAVLEGDGMEVGEVKVTRFEKAPPRPA